jgi:hypothetical protein
MGKIIFAAALAIGLGLGGATAEAKHHHRHHHHHHFHGHHWRGVCGHEIFCTPMPCGDWYYWYRDQI